MIWFWIAAVIVVIVLLVLWWFRSRTRVDATSTHRPAAGSRTATGAAAADAADTVDTAATAPAAEAMAPAPAASTTAPAATTAGDGEAGGAPFGPGSAAAAEDGSGPADHEIKGNAEMRYHTPESPYYRRTKAEVWFETEAAAEAAGFTRWDRRGSDTTVDEPAATTDEPEAADVRSFAATPADTGEVEVEPVASSGDAPFAPGSAAAAGDGSGPAGYEIKGNADSKRYHTPESPYYRRTKADVWFDTEANAEAAGFSRWDNR